METLRVGKVKHVELANLRFVSSSFPSETSDWEYDEGSDVLDISFGKPKPALSLDLGSGIVLRYLEKSGEIVGFTIIGLKHVVKSEVPSAVASPS